jgi:hypothetical protein
MPRTGSFQQYALLLMGRCQDALDKPNLDTKRALNCLTQQNNATPLS